LPRLTQNFHFLPAPLEAKPSNRGHSRVSSVISVKTGIQIQLDPQSSWGWQRVCHSRVSSVIPVKTGIQIQLDPQSSWGWQRMCHSRVSSVIPVKTGIQI